MPATQVHRGIVGRDFDCVQEEGWGEKKALHKLKLVDSVLKEIQRRTPKDMGWFNISFPSSNCFSGLANAILASLHRFVKKAIRLSDGTLIPKGSTVLVPNQQMWNPDVYPDPERFDPYRFLKLRDSSTRAAQALFVSPSANHMGFGLGKYACPGRFFASNEIKILLCHVLLKYDLRLFRGYTVQCRRVGVVLNADPQARIEIRRRREEVAL